MTSTFAFDVYGTLIDTAGIAASLQHHIGDQAAPFAGTWRQKQLEYSFRRGLMRAYQPFPVCTRQALDYTCRQFQIDLSEADKSVLMEAYRRLPAFADVEKGLQTLQEADCRLFAFSNGPAADVAALLANAAVEDYFVDIVSVDEIGSFKPDPGVYEHFLQRAGAERRDSWLVSSNPFDVLGAAAVGMRTAWVRRSAAATFDPWGIEPDLEIGNLGELVGALP